MVRLGFDGAIAKYLLKDYPYMILIGVPILYFQVETPPQKWEFYICSVLHERLGALGDVFDAVSFLKDMLQVAFSYVIFIAKKV